MPYVLEYSDDAGSNWFSTGLDPFVGEGTVIEATDPAGAVPGRTYQVVVPGAPLIADPFIDSGNRLRHIALNQCAVGSRIFVSSPKTARE